MEPRHEEREESKDREPRAEANEAKPRRFRIVKLEERIAPVGPVGNDNSHPVRICGLTNQGIHHCL
jgi:hypothetical protein